jgi:hypothetical protein
MICTRCQGTGFLNIHQLPEELQKGTVDSAFQYLQSQIKYKKVTMASWHDLVLQWITTNDDHDVRVCDCCGDGEYWYGVPGEHDHRDYGNHVPYANNGGLPKCY